jgi:polyisoprenoid-binding protein YceI
MRKFLILAAASLLAGCISIESNEAPAAAAPTVAPSHATGVPLGEASRIASEQPAGAYELDGRHASVIWRLRHAGVGVFAARFDTIAGTLNFDPVNPANSTLSVTIAANSVNTGVLGRDGARSFDEEIHTQVLGSAATPEIRFVSRSITLTGPTSGVINGDLTVRGVTKPVAIDASFDGGRFIAFRGKQVLGFTGRTMINRKDFGAKLNNPMADGFAGDQVEILIAAEFIQK